MWGKTSLDFITTLCLAIFLVYVNTDSDLVYRFYSLSHRLYFSFLVIFSLFFVPEPLQFVLSTARESFGWWPCLIKEMYFHISSDGQKSWDRQGSFMQNWSHALYPHSECHYEAPSWVLLLCVLVMNVNELRPVVTHRKIITGSGADIFTLSAHICCLWWVEFISAPRHTADVCPG